MNWLRILSVALAVSVALTGPATVVAQSKEPEAALPAATAAPAATEADKGDPAPADTAYKVGAGVATVINVPMRTGLCALGAAGGLAVLIVTFGSGYRFAARVVEEGCGGPWIITPEHLRGRKD